MLELDAVQINFNQDNLLIMNIALAIVMFGVALGISLEDFKNLSKQPRTVLLGIMSQFILLPLLTFLLILLLQPKPSIALGMMMVAACPGGNISNFMTQHAKGNAALSVSLTAIATIFAVVMTPLNFQFYGNLYPPTAEILRQVSLDPMALIKIVLLILGVPLVFGMLVRSQYRELANKLSTILKPLSLLIFMVFVVIALLNNLDIFQQTIQYIIGYGVIHNILAFSLGFLLASIFSVSHQDRKTLTIETGIQNSGLGLVLIFTFFDGLGGMALIAAFWGIWHIVSGLILSSYWAKSI